MSGLYDNNKRSTRNITADAVGVSFSENKHWYIAIVKHGNEKICCEKLLEYGYESYIPMQRVLRQYANGRKKWVDRIVITSKVFVHVTESDRLKNVVTLPFISRFMVDPSRKNKNNGRAAVAIVPDKEMEMFRHMMDQDEIPVNFEENATQYSSGDKVRVVYGKLAGLEGTIVRVADNKHRLYVSLDILGAAYVEIDSSYLEFNR